MDGHFISIPGVVKFGVQLYSSLLNVPTDTTNFGGQYHLHIIPSSRESLPTVVLMYFQCMCARATLRQALQLRRTTTYDFFCAMLSITSTAYDVMRHRSVCPFVLLSSRSGIVLKRGIYLHFFHPCTYHTRRPGIQPHHSCGNPTETSLLGRQEAQLLQRDRATLRVIEYSAKSFKVTQDHSK